MIDKHSSSFTISFMDWNDQFLELYDRCLEHYQAGNTNYSSYYSDCDLIFLASIGYKPRELFDFIEDFADAATPTRSTALLVASVRRDYFDVAQDRVQSKKEITGAELAAKSDARVGGIPYFARIIQKAEAKLRGELDPNIMFGCGGDRNFLKSNGNIPMADFLRNIWAANGDEKRIIAYVTSKQEQS